MCGPGQSVPGPRTILRQVMSRAFFGQGSTAQNGAYMMMGPAPMGFGAQQSIVSRSSALTPVLGNLPGLDLPSLQLTGALAPLPAEIAAEDIKNGRKLLRILQREAG